MIFLSLGLFVFIIVLPAVVLIVKPMPQSMGLLPDGNTEPPQASGEAPVLEGVVLREAIRMPTFWLIAAGFMLAGASLFGMLAHQTGYIESIGFSRETASLALGFTAGVGILGKIALGIMAERISVRFAAVLCFGIQLIGVVVLFMTTTMFLVWVYAIVFGFSMGGLVTLRTLINVDYFGSASIGSILGISSLVFAIGPAFGPLYAAYIYDFTQSYRLSFLSYIALYLAAMLLIFLARKSSVSGRRALPAVKPAR